MSRWDDFDGFGPDHWYAPSTPRRVSGGIRTRTQRGAIGETWWAKRWIQVLEGFGIGSRLKRGKLYARAGQVLSLDVLETGVKAKVQGSRQIPYDVSMQFGRLSDAEWEKVIRSFNGQPILLAKLLAGELPPEAEEVFTAAGGHLFPANYWELRAHCSCPDQSNPCKHLAAVFYLLADAFDTDPFLLFTLRGRTREQLLEALIPPEVEDHEDTPEPLAITHSSFWHGRPLPPADLPLSPAAQHAPLLRRLGPFPFWRMAGSLIDLLEPDYRNASAKATKLDSVRREP